jgi:hypothetical protein
VTKASSAPLKPAVKWLCLVVGALLALGALAVMTQTGMKAWLLWQTAKQHPGSPLPQKLIAAFAGNFVGEILWLCAGLWLVSFSLKKRESTEEAISTQASQPGQVRVTGLAPTDPRTMKKGLARAPIKGWSSCNVLHVGADPRHLWGFGVGKNGFSLNREHTLTASDSLPANLVAKDWRTLFQKKLNIALLPVDKAFLRVIHLPVSSFDETLAMVELQLEKLSPLPVTHVVWSIQILPQQLEGLQTVIVIIVARELVEQVLGQLEGQGYLADRLEVPLIDQLQATPITGDGAWIYPGTETGRFTALVAWWYGGVLRSLGLLHVAAAQNRGELLEEQLKQMTWAGELEGWLKGAPRWHLVADEITARVWQPMFFSWLGHEVDVETPIAAADLAGLTANRAARAEGRANILPPDYATRYRQQFVDRLWIRGLGTVIAAYLVGVFVYFVLMGVQTYRTQGVETQAKGLSRTYTNTLQLKAQMEILQERQALKYAFLDCWKTTAELLPEGLTLTSFDFREGKTLTLNGSAPADSKLVSDFNNGMRKAMAPSNDQLLFRTVNIPNRKLDTSRTTETWTFPCELLREEKE